MPKMEWFEVVSSLKIMYYTSHYEIKMIKESDEKELVDAWVSKFWELQECPSCSGKVLETGVCEGCEKNYFD